MAVANLAEFEATPRLEKGTIEDNPINLERDTVERILPELDAHVASLFTLFHQYQKHHWLVEGPNFMEIHRQLEAFYNQVHKQLDEMAERITALGGIPTSEPGQQVMLSYITHEPEGIFTTRDMLTRDRFHEGQIAEKLRGTIELATELGDHATAHMLAQTLEETEERAHHLDHYLGEDSL